MKVDKRFRSISLRILFSILTFGNAGFANMVLAEIVQIPLAAQGGEHAAAINKPSKGTTQQSVLAEFGSPIAQTPAVGSPPISRWEYANYYVYFENKHVIHAVLKHKPIE